MAALSLLDTNVLVRHLRQDHASHSPRATAFLARVQRGEVIVRLVDTVVFETVFTLEKVYAVQVERFHLGSITSFDQGYDRLPGFTREEP